MECVKKKGVIRMRDPKRLKGFYEQLEYIHRTNFPDWRFSQFLSNFVSWYGNDIFYLEENEILGLLNLYVLEIKGRKV